MRRPFVAPTEGTVTWQNRLAGTYLLGMTILQKAVVRENQPGVLKHSFRLIVLAQQWFDFFAESLSGKRLHYVADDSAAEPLLLLSLVGITCHHEDAHFGSKASRLERQ
jgi:hypothetical protein